MKKSEKLIKDYKSLRRSFYGLIGSLPIYVFISLFSLGIICSGRAEWYDYGIVAINLFFLAQTITSIPERLKLLSKYAKILPDEEI